RQNEMAVLTACALAHIRALWRRIASPTFRRLLASVHRLELFGIHKGDSRIPYTGRQARVTISATPDVILFGERRLRHVIEEFVAQYHGERNHQGLGNELIAPQCDQKGGTH